MLGETRGGGVALSASVGLFSNCTFSQIRAGRGAALSIGYQGDDGRSEAQFSHCVFTDNIAQAASVWIGRADKVDFLGCAFLRNDGCAVVHWDSNGGEIVDSLFQENTDLKLPFRG
jgi:hypothetical protein